MAHIESFDYDVTQGLDTGEIRKAPTAVLFDYNIPNKLFSKSKIIRLDSLF